MRAPRTPELPAPHALPTRRDALLSLAALAGASALPGCSTLGSPKVGPGEKLRLGFIGCANRGWDNLQDCKGEEVVALCDVDSGYLDHAAQAFPKARRYVDFREMLEANDLHAVVVSTPDHTHAVAAARALKKGLDVYCEKPLAHTVAEARTLALLAKEHGAITQMGTQMHQQDNYHRVIELVRSGALGRIREVHAFCDKSWSAKARPTEETPVPKTLAYDLWLGPVAPRPFHASYHPGSWRRYWDFGGGTLADMGCHYLDLAFTALELGAPVRIAAKGPPPDAYAAPHGIAVEWAFPGTARRDALQVTWSDGEVRCAKLAELGLSKWRNGVLFVGENGAVVADYTNREIAPKGKLDGVPPPPRTERDGLEHHREWLDGCRTRTRTSCDFAYAANLTETVLLGAVAYRVGHEIAWNSRDLVVPGDPKANELLRTSYRAGFEL